MKKAKETREHVYGPVVWLKNCGLRLYLYSGRTYSSKIISPKAQ